MKEIFLLVVSTTVLPTVLFLLMAIFSVALKKYCSAKTRFALSKLNLVLFLCPVILLVTTAVEILDISIASEYTQAPTSVATEIITGQGITTPTVPVNVASNTASNIPIDFPQILSVMWVAYMAISLLLLTFRHILYLRHIKVGAVQNYELVPILQEVKSRLNIHKPVSIYNSKTCTTPMLAGFFRHSVIIPCQSYSKSQLSSIITHELYHLKRRDIWWILLLEIAKIVHCFNPAVHIFASKFKNILEISCDELVSEQLTHSDKQQYALSILNSATTNTLAVLSLSSNKHNLKERITSIMSQKKNSKLVKSIAYIASITIMVALIAPSAINTAKINFAEKQNINEVEKTYVDEENNFDTLDIVDTKAEDSVNSVPDAPEDSGELSGINVAKSEMPTTTPNSEITQIEGAYSNEPWEKKYGNIISGTYVYLPIGEVVFAVSSGIVTEVSETSVWPWGRSVVYETAQGEEIRIAHLSEVSVGVGDEVTIDTKVGEAGISGAVSTSGYGVNIESLNTQTALANEEEIEEESFTYPEEYYTQQGKQTYAPLGAAVFAVSSGTVTEVPEMSWPWGIAVVYETAQGEKVRIAHLSEVSVAVGDEVTADTKVGEAGTSGYIYNSGYRVNVYVAEE